jgi:hypothetical protein
VTGPDQQDGLSSEAHEFIARAVGKTVEGLAARLDALSEQLAAIHQATGPGDGQAGSRAPGRGRRAGMSESAQAILATEYPGTGAQRDYRQLMKLTLEALDTELAPASQGLAAIHEVTVKLHQSLGIVSGRVAGVLRVIQAVRGRLDEIDTHLDQEAGEGHPEAGEEEEEA